ncbi:MAG: rhodanese-like domain-containing protein [Rhodobacteraceae bacterium]|nr:rhodanese-like domain-containing protein [Paracoccaceae bacterium]
MVVAPVSFWSFMTPQFAGQSLSVSEAHQQAQSGDITLIDIRRPDEWKRSGVGVGATPLDMRRKDFIEALDLIVAGDRSRPVALICARGVRSAKLSKKLTAAGFTQIIDVPEGMAGSRAGLGWLKTKLPTVEYQGASK